MEHENTLDWERAVNEITDLYRNVEKRSLSLPVFSLTPFIVGVWNIIKFGLCLFLDIILIIPLNAVIFIRNVFPGKWRYRSFSWPYIKYAITWVWRGEAPYFPFAVIRPLVRLSLAAHIQSRLRTIQRYIYLDESLSDAQRQHLTSKVTSALGYWGRPGMLRILYTYVLPVSGPVIQAIDIYFRRSSPCGLVF